MEANMRLLHLSDLHIGKRVNEFSMLDDQKYILAEIIEIIKKEQVDGVLIAGDVYDKPVPSAEAVQVFDIFLTNLAECEIPVFVISGNHDSAERLSFGSNLMKSRNVHVSPVFNGVPEHVMLADEYGEICIYMLPFIKPAIVRHVFEEMEISSYHEAVKEVLERLEVDESKRNIIVAHQFVTGASRCESEDISVGGLDNVDVSVFDVFDYVALGHIHGAQQMGRREVRYCGTPLKYSFSESNHIKSATIVEMKAKGDVEIREIPLIPRRDMREIKGTYQEVTALEFYKDMNRMDYLHITLTDEEDIPDALNKLRVIYPNIMKMDYDNTRTKNNQEIAMVEQMGQKSPLQLFEELYELQNNQKMSEEQQAFIQRLIEQIWEE